MLPSSNRLTIPLFAEVMDKGKLVHASFLSAKFIKKTGITRFSVVISKKVAKNATDRNKIRRRTYTALRPLLPYMPETHGVLMMKAGTNKLTIPALTSALKEIFVKSGFLK